VTRHRAEKFRFALLYLLFYSCSVNLGYLTTEDENAPGNWGFSDQVQALDFVKKNIKAFRGDPEKITLMGDTAGAVSVGLHLISPASRRKGFYIITDMPNL